MSLTNFGQLIRKLRVQTDSETLSTMARELGMTVPKLSSIECGKIKVADPVLNKILNFFEIRAVPSSQIIRLREFAREQNEMIEKRENTKHKADKGYTFVCPPDQKNF